MNGKLTFAVELAVNASLNVSVVQDIHNLAKTTILNAEKTLGARLRITAAFE